MPFTYRDKPKLADRLRGKSSEEILNELKNDLDPQGRRMLFDPPSWRTRQNNPGFPRGFPFEDDRNRNNIRTYLDEIAARHPEFADQLREPSWREDFVDPSYPTAETSQTQQGSGNEAHASGSQIPSEAREPKATLSNFGLRNTVPLGPGTNVEDNRYQRSMSAPPEHRIGDKPKRFVTKCEIPVMNNPDPVQMKPEFQGKGVQEPPQQKANNAPNVRVIPIQVEGRDTPIVNANVDTATNFGSEAFRDPSFEGRLPRDFGNYQRHSPRFAHKERTPSPTPFQYAPQYQQYAPPGPYCGPPLQPQFMPQQRFAPPQPHPFAPQQQHPQRPPAPPPMQRGQEQQYYQQYPQHHFQQQPQQHFQQQPQQHFQQQPQQHFQQQPQPQPQQQQHHHQQHQQHHHQQQQQQKQQQQQQQQQPPPQAEEMAAKPPHPPKPEPPKDPIEKVEAIQKEVEGLMKQVEAFKGNSRTDKQYLMLDELLTRQLLLLDNIETEGKENVRQARKDTIRSIQRCISTLENKVPVPENAEAATESNGNQGEQKEEGSGGAQAMEVDSKENTQGEKKAQNMEVDEKGNEGAQGTQKQQEPQQEQQQQQNQQQITKEESKEKV